MTGDELEIQLMRRRLRNLVDASIAYDEAIRACGNDPERITQYRTVQGEDLDALYAQWMVLARMAKQYLDFESK